MYTVMRIVGGNRSPIDLEEYTLGDHNSQVFAEAMRYAKESDVYQQVSLADASQLIKAQKEFESVECENAANYCQEISCVELELHHPSTGLPPSEMVCMGTRSGSRALEDAIGVLAYELPDVTDPDDPGYMCQTSRWEFIYPGDSVFVTNRFGKTVDSLR